jgi:tetratricopeptide (TPR) repeat protein
MPRILRIAAPVLALAGFVCAGSNPLEDARKELYAARYDHAVELYRKTLALDPAQPEAYYGLVRALLRSHHSAEAYEAADQGLSKAPQTAGVETAAGMAIYRRGDLIKAQDYFAAALKIDANYPGALEGLAVINNAASQFAKGRRLSLEAYKNSPDDPALMSIHANTLKGAEHLAALAELLAIYDPQSREARAVRAHIASDKALGDKKVRRLTSPYEASQMKLVRLWKGPTRARGVIPSITWRAKCAPAR